MKRINDKIKKLKKYLIELEEIIPDNFKNYNNNNEKIAATERYFEKIIETMLDIAFLIIKRKKYTIPEDDFNAFEILYENKIIDEKLLKKLKEAKGMRNFIIHQYEKIDNEIVFEAIKYNLFNDSNSFIKQILQIKNL
jgi:uncharacterized protein YutE (UPF0331/DUF86 family)